MQLWVGNVVVWGSLFDQTHITGSLPAAVPIFREAGSTGFSSVYCS
jgi:hypothetical protein